MKLVKSFKFTILLVAFCLISGISNLVFSSDSNCPELLYLPTEYIQKHKEDMMTKCMNKGYIEDNCFILANDAYDKFMNCFEDCGGYNDKGCEDLSMKGDCSYYECTNKIDNNCATKCKDYLLFEYENNNDAKEDLSSHDIINSDLDNSENKSDDDNQNVDSDSFVNFGNFSCSGDDFDNSKLCPDDDKEVLSYTEKDLVQSCSEPEGSEPKCEYVCKKGYIFNGEFCERRNILNSIFNWFRSLF